MKNFLVDSHCHLNYDGLYERLEEVITNSENSGVGVLQTISTKMSDFSSLQSIVQKHKNIFYSVGVHPLNVHEEKLVEVDELVELINGDLKISGIGETGLDYYRVADFEQIELQKESFKRQIAAAQQTDLPVIVHTRDAENDTIDILETMMCKQSFSGVLHCFTGSMDLAMKAIELGFYISASGIITFKNADDIRMVFKQIPIEKILIETDSPFLAPVPYRGKINEPAYVVEVAKAIAELKSTSYEEIINFTTNNFFELFKRCKYR